MIYVKCSQYSTFIQIEGREFIKRLMRFNVILKVYTEHGSITAVLCVKNTSFVISIWIFISVESISAVSQAVNENFSLHAVQFKIALIRHLESTFFLSFMYALSWFGATDM